VFLSHTFHFLLPHHPCRHFLQSCKVFHATVHCLHPFSTTLPHLPPEPAASAVLRFHKLSFPTYDCKDDSLDWLNKCEQFFYGTSPAQRNNGTLFSRTMPVGHHGRSLGCCASSTSGRLSAPTIWQTWRGCPSRLRWTPTWTRSRPVRCVRVSCHHPRRRNSSPMGYRITSMMTWSFMIRRTFSAPCA
jgi:hypothetical protein